MGSRPRATIVYLFNDYPGQSGTFPNAELHELIDRGLHVEVFCIRSLGHGPLAIRPTHPCCPVLYAKYLSLAALAATFRCLFRNPVLFLRSLAHVIWDCRTSLRILFMTLGIVPKACLYADIVRRRTDIVWLQAYWASMPGRVAWWISSLTKRPYGTWAHAGADIYNRLHQTPSSLKTVLSSASHILTCNHANIQYFEELIPGTVMKRVHFQSHGIDLNRFTFKHTWPRHAAGEPYRLLSVGNLTSAKGFRYAIEACALLRDRGLRLVYTIVGEGRQRTDLEALVQQLDLASCVFLPGSYPQEELSAFYQEADFFIMPSIVGPHGGRDGLPNVVLEAMASGLPVLGSDAVGIPEAVQHLDTGILFAPGNPLDLATKLESALEHPERLRSITEKARTQVELRYSRKACMDTLYQRLLEALPQGTSCPPARCDIAGSRT